MRRLSAALVLLLLSFSVSHAWKEVGNAAGISEQNLTYARENAGALLASVETPYLQGFARALPRIQLRFNYEDSAKVFEVSGLTWTLFSKNLSAYDLDRDDVLSLKESLLLFLDIYRSQSPLEDRAFSDMRSLLTRFLDAQGQSQVLRNGDLRLQWSEYASAYWLRFPDTRALVLEEKDFSSICQGQMSQLRVLAPYIKSSQETEKGIQILLGAVVQYRCEGQMTHGPLLLEIGISKDPAAMRLQALEVLN